MSGCVILIVALLMSIDHRPHSMPLLDRMADPIADAGLQDGDAIIVSIPPHKKSGFVGQDIEVWVCGGKLYGPYHEMEPHWLDRLVWRWKQ